MIRNRVFNTDIYIIMWLYDTYTVCVWQRAFVMRSTMTLLFPSKCTKKEGKKTTKQHANCAYFLLFFDYHYWNVNRERSTRCMAKKKKKTTKKRKMTQFRQHWLQFSNSQFKKTNDAKKIHSPLQRENENSARVCIYITRSIGWHSQWVIQFVLLERLFTHLCSHTYTNACECEPGRHKNATPQNHILTSDFNSVLINFQSNQKKKDRMRENRII